MVTTRHVVARGLARAVVWLGNVHRRAMGVYFAILGPEVAYAVTGWLGRALYGLLDPLRIQSEAQGRAALAGRVPRDQVPTIAERAFVHRVWNVTDLLLADRLLHPGTWFRYGGRIAEHHRRRLIDALNRKQPVILLTGYYGPFDLLPIFLGFNGVRAGVVYRRHGNVAFDKYRRRVRSRGGCELVPLEQAGTRLGEILADGGAVAIVADHHAQRGGLPATFLGLPTKVIRSVGLLAWRYNADVIVAGLRRVGDGFRFEIVVTDIMDHTEWAAADDPVVYVTQRYLRGLEALVLGDPSQYLWGYARWGRDVAQELMEADAATDEG